MAALTPKIASLSGVDPTSYPSADAGGDSFAANSSGRYLIHGKNGHTSSQRIVIDDPNSTGPASATTFDPDVTITVPASGEQMSTIKDVRRFRDANGDISLSYPDGVTALTLQIVQV